MRGKTKRKTGEKLLREGRKETRNLYLVLKLLTCILILLTLVLLEKAWGNA